MALKRALRLRKSSEFQQVRREGRRITSRLLVLMWAPNPAAHLRVGFVVSKRVSKRAVDRNRLKRLLSEAIKPYLAELPHEWDIVLSAKQDMLTADLRTLEEDVPALLRRAHLFAPARGQGTDS